MPNRTFAFVLPFPPSVNHYWIHTRVGVKLGKSGREYRQKVANAVAPVLSGFPTGVFPSRKRLAICLTLIMPDKRERDVDNYNKGIFDSLAHAGVYVKDSQIDDLRVIRGHVAPPGCVKVLLKEL